MSATNQTHTARMHNRRARISAIRRRVLAVAIAMFVAVWVALLVQLASGHDPALAQQTTASGQTSGWLILLVLLCVGPVLGVLVGRVSVIRPRSQPSRRPVAS